MTDHERIWLEPALGADDEFGRQWCQDNVWGDDATEYVRADLVDDLRAQLSTETARAERAEAALNTVKIMPRGGVERNWEEEYQLLSRQFRKLAKSARLCVEEVDKQLATDNWPVKYRAPFGPLAELRKALPETYDEFKARATVGKDRCSDCPPIDYPTDKTRCDGCDRALEALSRAFGEDEAVRIMEARAALNKDTSHG